MLINVVNPAAADPIRVVDQRGKTIELAKPAERIVTIPMPMASVVMAIDGSSRRVVGMHPAARKSVQDGFLKKVYPDAAAIPADVVRGGMFTPNLEALTALRPDVVIQWTEPPDLIRTLENAGFTTVGLINSPPNQDVHERNMAIVGAVIGQTARIDRLLGLHRSTRAKVEAALAGLPPAERPRVLYLRATEGTPMAAGRNTYQDFWIGLCGGRNVAAETIVGTETPIGAEQIVAWDPQVIFIGTFDDATPKTLYANPAFAAVSAIRDKRVYKLPHGGYRWDPGNQESHLTWMWAAQLLHPDRVNFDVRAAIAELYPFLYSYSPSQSEIDAVLQLPLNKSMRHYERFAGR
ncbi:ABC transporter substrate-binding protein [Xanthobacteraceae bacterium Astr-EGSB]|uniref:ABC transporter substrate-binding protein n=1 Tax=Astrobacterium formosum TaxID=3069710 RepID=UPI0027AFF3A1|nr:ABC transporter substrate-binding protein [Xanthobacteraceae bacterium Astr-EGSB]